MHTALPEAGPEDLGRLRWRCRRGMKELDLLLARYLERDFCGASSREQAAFRGLLETPDPVLHAYCLGSDSPPPEFAALIARITAYSTSDRGPADHGPTADRSPAAERNPRLDP
jgi:antitoxin CptB